mgnify:CR=1 FL=1
MPFAGELIEVRDSERDWEGAIERLLRNFGLSLLVPEAQYKAVAEWIDRTQLKGRLVYFSVRPPKQVEAPALHADALVRTLGTVRVDQARIPGLQLPPLPLPTETPADPAPGGQ